MECPGIPGPCPARVPPVLTTSGHPDLHSLQLQRSWQSTLCMERPRIVPALAHLSNNCPSRVPPVQNTPRTSWPMPWPWHQLPLPEHPLHEVPWDAPAITHFSFSCPARTPSLQRAPGSPQSRPTLALAIPPGQPQQSAQVSHPMPATAPGNYPVTSDTQATKGTMVHKTIPSNVGEVAVLLNS